MLAKFKAFVVWKIFLKKWKGKPWIRRNYTQHFYQRKYLHPEYINAFYDPLMRKKTDKNGGKIWTDSSWKKMTMNGHQMHDTTQAEFRRHIIWTP